MNQLEESRDLIQHPGQIAIRKPTRSMILDTTRIFALSAVFAVMGLLSFGQTGKVINDRNAEKREVKGFHAISISSGIDLYLSQGNEEGVAVSSSDPSTQRRIRTEVVDGVLKIYLDTEGSHWGWSNRNMKAYVSFKELNELRASGGSDVYAEDGIKAEKLAIHLSGGSDLKAKTNVGTLAITATGGSDVYISGTAASLSVEATGGSDLHGFDLVTDVCNVTATGGSDIKIGVNKELNVTASGGSDVYYKGTAVIHEMHSSGSSDIIKKG
jgi:hypothetical protein